MGKLLTCLPRLSLAQLRPTLWSTIVLCMCRRDLYFPIAPMGKLLTCLPRLTLANCEYFGQYNVVRATETLKTSHRPDGQVADVLASTLAHTTAADAPVNYRLLYVPQRLKSSHRPMGRLLTRLL